MSNPYARRYRPVGYTSGDTANPVPLHCDLCQQRLKYAWFFKSTTNQQIVLGNECVALLTHPKTAEAIEKAKTRAIKALKRWSDLNKYGHLLSLRDAPRFRTGTGAKRNWWTAIGAALGSNDNLDALRAYYLFDHMIKSDRESRTPSIP